MEGPHREMLTKFLSNEIDIHRVSELVSKLRDCPASRSDCKCNYKSVIIEHLNEQIYDSTKTTFDVHKHVMEPHRPYQGQRARYCKGNRRCNCHGWVKYGNRNDNWDDP